jgi:cytochrome c-type biogenesis protein CcmH
MMVDLRSVAICGLLAAATLLPRGVVLAQQDRGQPMSPDQALAFGPNVTRAVGLPAGPPVSGAELHRRTEDLTSRMRCPVCQGHAVVDSPAEGARNMKREVHAMIAAGFSEDQILRYFEGAYGEFIRLMPRPTGFNLLVWLIPIAGAALGLIGMFVMFRRRRAGAGPTNARANQGSAQPEAKAQEAAGPGTDDEALGDWLAKVREEVERRDA